MREKPKNQKAPGEVGGGQRRGAGAGRGRGRGRGRAGAIRARGDPPGQARGSLGADSGGIRPPERGARLEELLPELQDELEKRQEKKTPRGPEERNPRGPAVKGSGSRSGKVTFQLPPEAAPGPEERVCPFWWRSSALRETLRQLQASVTLDPDTAHPELEVSPDGKSVRRGSIPRWPLPPNPERFELWPFVLGQQRFSSGQHCWDVEVGDGGDWALGVARESVRRKGRLSLGPPGGIWGLEKWGGQVRALTARRVTPVVPRGLPRRVRVHLDCGEGSVAFFDAQHGGLLFAFSRVSFGGEGLRPWLWVVGVRSELRLWP